MEIARADSCLGRLARVDLLVVPVFGADGGCTDATALIAMLNALIVV